MRDGHAAPGAWRAAPRRPQAGARRSRAAVPAPRRAPRCPRARALRWRLTSTPCPTRCCGGSRSTSTPRSRRAARRPRARPKARPRPRVAPRRRARRPRRQRSRPPRWRSPRPRLRPRRPRPPRPRRRRPRLRRARPWARRRRRCRRRRRSRCLRPRRSAPAARRPRSRRRPRRRSSSSNSSSRQRVRAPCAPRALLCPALAVPCRPLSCVPARALTFPTSPCAPPPLPPPGSPPLSGADSAHDVQDSNAPGRPNTSGERSRRPPAFTAPCRPSVVRAPRCADAPLPPSSPCASAAPYIPGDGTVAQSGIHRPSSAFVKAGKVRSARRQPALTAVFPVWPCRGALP
jgi:hypothetical protein